MQPCNRIYYSTVHWRLNMLRAAYRSSSGAPTVFVASGLHTHVVTGRSQVPLRLDYGRSPHAYVNQRLQIRLELLMMSGMPLEASWALNERWNNKFYYKMHLVGYFYWFMNFNITHLHEGFTIFVPSGSGTKITNKMHLVGYFCWFILHSCILLVVL